MLLSLALKDVNSLSKLTIIGSDNGLSPGRHQAIIWPNAGILLICPLGKKLQWNLNKNSYIFIQENAFENAVWKMAAIFSQPQCYNFCAWAIESSLFSTTHQSHQSFQKPWD